MNKEIKINKASKSITFVNNGIGFSQFGIADEILDLITNLQQENERLKNKSDILEETNAMVIQQKYNLERELDSALDKLDKAVEFIEKIWKEKSFYENVENCLKFCEINEFEKEDLLNILQNGSEEK